MANNPKKVKDPTEVALSAIQEALNISDVNAVDDGRGSARSDVTPANMSSTPDYNEPAFDTRPSVDRPTFDPIEEPRATRRAANDDRESRRAAPPATSIRSPRCLPASGFSARRY